MIKEAIILAGGLGTRLRDSLPDLPKSMAPVSGCPFLFYVINYLRSQGIERFIFSLGYKHEIIETYLSEHFSTLDYQCSVESEPLGTGGAIRLACPKGSNESIVVANGDTLFRAVLEKAISLHQSRDGDCTLLLKPLTDFNRYGTVELDESGYIKSFKEKQFLQSGTINGGLYILNRERFLKRDFPAKFSFETDYLEKPGRGKKICGWIDDSYFIDIGVPEDYNRARSDLHRAPLQLSVIDKNWTLFIDRDGVINHEKKEDYIRNVEEFRFFDGVKQALARLSGHFDKIIVVSNQRGVGRGLMTEADLEQIHQKMRLEIENAGGRIDGIYYCTSTDNKHPDRKPNPGMAFRAQKDFPGIQFPKSIMIGNKLSDMLFSRNAGMYGVFVATTNPDTPSPHPDIDLRFDSLPHFANSLE